VERPQDLQPLVTVVDRLVTCGGARIPRIAAEYLRFIGVVGIDDLDEWVWPTPQFVERALPANDPTDLLRRALIRDPKYRLHVDLALCSVIHAVAVSERWRRFEELLFGGCKTVAPRLLQLLSWLSAVNGASIRTVSSQIQQAIYSKTDPAFRDWDQQLWGESRSPADLFPLLLDLYVPLYEQPMHVSATFGLNGKLLASLMNAAAEGEGLRLSADQLQDLRALQDFGLPVHVEQRGDHMLRAFLVGAVEFGSDEADRIGDFDDVHWAVPRIARVSSVLPALQDRPRWSIARETEVYAPISVADAEPRWPEQALSDAPPWNQLPGSLVISTAAKRRKDSENADEALLQVAQHPLYGFLLQLFLLEALDRELGEETLALALPQNRKLETAEDWAETQLLYRPRDESDSSQPAEREGFLVLGSLDEVLPIIGRECGIKGIANPYHSNGMPWSRAVYLLSTAGIVDGRPHNWRLTITTFVLDRLHSGTLMKDIIRGGRLFRDQLHQVLAELWKEHTRKVQEEQIPT
jgi:hypothetical protein